MIGDPVVTWLPSAADSRHAKINSCHMIRDADRLRRDGQCRVYSRRRREEGSIHNKQVAMVEGSAELVQNSLARVATEADRSALMRNGESSHVLLDVDSETNLFHQRGSPVRQALVPSHVVLGVVKPDRVALQDHAVFGVRQVRNWASISAWP